MSDFNYIEKVDSHQHFWLRERGDYHWLTPDLYSIFRDFNADDLRPYLDTLGISKTVLVQAAETDQETDFLLLIAKQVDFVAGVVGWIDMEAPGATDRLSFLAKNPLFKGLRPMIQDIPDTEWMLKPTLEPVFQNLIDLDLCFDALVKPVHLNTLATLLQRYPDLKVVIDHGAKPDIANGDFSQWADNISSIANSSQAFCKLSGLITEAGTSPSFKQVEPYLDHLLGCFGAERLMWGSDWPVINLTSNYESWGNYSEAYLSQISRNEQRSIWSKTATKFYSL